MKKRDLIMLGIIIGIAFFFIGAIISNVFPSSDEELLPYKMAAVNKLLGLGFLTTSMVIGGLIIDDIDKNQRTLLLLLGLILLIIYSIGSPALEWEIGSYDSSGYDSRPTGYGIPGFEIIFVIISIISFIILHKIKTKR